MCVAGFTLLDRLVVTAHRAGCSPIIVVSPNGPQRLERAAALEIPVRFLKEIPAFDRPVLIASSSILVTAADIRVLLNRGGRLADRNGSLLPIGLVPKPAHSIDAALASLAPVAPIEVARRVIDTPSAREAER